MISRFADLFSRPKAITDLLPAFERAVAEGNTPKIRELYSKNNDLLSIIDDEGSTPLHWAAKAQNLSSVACLIDLGASPTIKDRLGYTPKDVAYWYGEFRMGAYTDSCLKIVDRILKAEQGAAANP